MVTNFDYLKNESKFSAFANVAISAEGKDWLNEMTVTGMPNKSGIGRIDYVLYDDMNKPLAIIEAKRTCKDIAEGRQQAKLYADLLEQEYKRRPVIFLTNGFETRIIDGQYPERWKEQSEMRLFHSVLSVRNICGNIISIYQKDIFDRMYRCHQNLYGIITL